MGIGHGDFSAQETFPGQRFSALETILGKRFLCPGTFPGQSFLDCKVGQIGQEPIRIPDKMRGVQNQETLPRAYKNGKLFSDGISTNSEKYSPLNNTAWVNW